jgi:D-alanyl-D-alanine carboxypeptidase (penicillin-binding protein 5/6)
MLFTGMLTVSGNDATRVLASTLGGDGAVLALMNAKAAQLQANDTVAKTVTGLDGPGQSTSAYDLALIARAALELPSFRKYIAVTTAQFAGLDVPGFQITTHNLLLGHYPGTFGVKNGYTDASRATYVGAATQNGHTLMVSLVRTDPNYRNAAESLLNWGFAADGKVAPVGELVGPKAATPQQTSAPVGAPKATTALAATNAPRPKKALNGLEYGGIGAGAALVVLFFFRRRQIRRRRMYRRGRYQLPGI